MLYSSSVVLFGTRQLSFTFLWYTIRWHALEFR